MILILACFSQCFADLDPNLVFYAACDDNEATNIVTNQVLTHISQAAVLASHTSTNADPNKVITVTANQTNYAGTAGNALTIRLVNPANVPSVLVGVYGTDVNLFVKVTSPRTMLGDVKTAFDACSAATDLMSLTTYCTDCNVYPVQFAKTNLSGGVDACDYNVANNAILNSLPAYLMSFCDANASPSTRLYLASSNDGITWTGLNNGTFVFATPENDLRDPTIFYNFSDGYWYVAYTNNNDANLTFHGNRIGICKSNNLINWAHVCWITFTGATITWAPEWFVDTNSSVHLLTAVGYRIKEVHPTDATFENWSNPVTIDRPLPRNSELIDPFVIKVDSNYIMYYRQYSVIPTDIERATATSLTGTYTTTDFNDWAGWGQKEGGCVIILPNGNTRIYCEVPLRAIGYSDYNGVSWSAFTICPSTNLGAVAMGHGTVIIYGSGSYTSYHSVGGKDGNALYFDGATYVDCNNTYESNSLTLSVWVKADDGQPSTLQTIFSKTVNDDNHFEVFLKPNDVFDANCFVNGVSKTVTLYQNDGNVFALADGSNNWIMLTAVLPDCNISGSGNLLIGLSFTGSLDDLRIYNKALSLSEIQQLYTTGGIKAENPDFDHDGDVDFDDLAELLSYWLKNEPSVDIAPQPNRDGIINLKDFAVFATHWLQGQ